MALLDVFLNSQTILFLTTTTATLYRCLQTVYIVAILLWSFIYIIFLRISYYYSLLMRFNMQQRSKK